MSGQPRAKSAASSRPNGAKSHRKGSSSSSVRPLERDGKVVGQYRLGKTLGEGTFGKVKIAIHIPTGEKVAVKVLEKNRIKDQADVRRVNREIKILKKAKHCNIIQLYEVFDTTETIYLMMENADGGEMFDYIVSHRYVQERQAAKFFHQLVDGVDVLHKAEITHRDLKPENLLLKSSPTGWILKIVDFGLSNTHEGGRLLSTACGSPCYAAPEMIAGKQYEGPLADIWSLGVILFALVCGFLPFEDANTAILYRKILAGDYKPAKWISVEVQDLIRRILETDPRKRYRFDDIRRHPWYCQVQDEDVPREYVSKSDSDAARAETMRVLEESGTNMQVVRDGLASRTCNSATAYYYLLELKIRNRMAMNPHETPAIPAVSAAPETTVVAQPPQAVQVANGNTGKHAIIPPPQNIAKYNGVSNGQRTPRSNAAKNQSTRTAVDQMIAVEGQGRSPRATQKAVVNQVGTPLNFISQQRAQQSSSSASSTGPQSALRIDNSNGTTKSSSAQAPPNPTPVPPAAPIRVSDSSQDVKRPRSRAGSVDKESVGAPQAPSERPRSSSTTTASRRGRNIIPVSQPASTDMTDKKDTEDRVRRPSFTDHQPSQSQHQSVPPPHPHPQPQGYLKIQSAAPEEVVAVSMTAPVSSESSTTPRQHTEKTSITEMVPLTDDMAAVSMGGPHAPTQSSSRRDSGSRPPEDTRPPATTAPPVSIVRPPSAAPTPAPGDATSGLSHGLNFLQVHNLAPVSVKPPLIRAALSFQ